MVSCNPKYYTMVMSSGQTYVAWEFVFLSGIFYLPIHGKVDPLIDRFVSGSIEFKNPLMHGYSKMLYFI